MFLRYGSIVTREKQRSVPGIHVDTCKADDVWRCLTMFVLKLVRGFIFISFILWIALQNN